MNLHDLHILRLVRDTGSFAAAARHLGRDPSFVSRSVAAVERALGLRIFERSTRNLRETAAGATYLDQVLPLVDGLDQAADMARGARGEARGLLRITASVAFTQMCLMPHLGGFRTAYPAVEIELLPTDTILDIVGNGIDLAIRLAPAPKGDLVSRRLIKTRYRVVAQPDWLAHHATLEDPSALTDIDVLRFALPGFRDAWRFRDAAGRKQTVTVSGGVVIAGALGLAEAARQGLGPALLADWLIADDLKRGRLVDLFPDWQVTATTFDTGAWALFPSRKYLPAKTRVALDFFANRLAASGAHV